MTTEKTDLQEMYRNERYPLSSKYDVQWVIENEMGPNVLWLTEGLCEVMKLQPGMRVLDMGCGKAVSSIFLAKECGVQVWATDLWIAAADNWKRICEAGVDDCVFPIHAEARSLPYADDFFDAIVSVDSYNYFGTDVHYLDFYMLKLLKRSGQIGIVIPASPQEVPDPLPDHLPAKVWYFMNSVEWWRHHWQRYPELEVELAEALADGWESWVRWYELLLAAGHVNPAYDIGKELEQLRADGGRHVGFAHMVARRKDA